MADGGGRWRYQLSELRGPDTAQMQEHLDLWTDAGWELVSGSTAAVNIAPHQQSVAYTMWWRQPAS